MKKDVSRYLFWSQTQREIIPPERIPDNIDLSKVVDSFSTHRCHLGAWPNTPPPTPNINITAAREDSISGIMSHVVRDVDLHPSGGLDVSFEFINTLRGFEFMTDYYEKTEEFQMVPVLDEAQINIVRFDFIKGVKL